MRRIGMFSKIVMRNACDSDSRRGLACDASARDAKSLARMWVERCEPLSPWRGGGWVSWYSRGQWGFVVFLWPGGGALPVGIPRPCPWFSRPPSLISVDRLRAAQAQRESGVKFRLGKYNLLSQCSLGCVARSSYNRNG